MASEITTSATAELWSEIQNDPSSNNRTRIVLGEVWIYPGMTITHKIVNAVIVTVTTRVPTARTRPWYSKFRKSRF